jgi:hypothetical protein
VYEVLGKGWITVYYYVQILKLTGRLCDEDVVQGATNRIRCVVQDDGPFLQSLDSPRCHVTQIQST